MIIQEASCKTRQVLTRIGSGECQSVQGCDDSQVWMMMMNQIGGGLHYSFWRKETRYSEVAKQGNCESLIAEKRAGVPGGSGGPGGVLGGGPGGVSGGLTATQVREELLIS